MNGTTLSCSTTPLPDAVRRTHLQTGYALDMAREVRNNSEANRYELIIDGDVAGFADYRVNGDIVIFPHTVINPDLRGQGLGDVLVTGALEDVRKSGRRVVPACWFVAEFIDGHSEYRDLLAS
jgi:predicted GNAT family acetyltransferase